MGLQPKYLVLDELLERRLFRVPNYQRSYSWVKKQRDDLFDDIWDLQDYATGRHHFMATVVCLNKDDIVEVGVDEFVTLDIVDGQQRITTLIILLKAIAKKLNPKNRIEKQIKGEINALLVKGDNRLILLQTNHDDVGIFSSYLEKGKHPDDKSIKTYADRAIASAFKECEQFVEKWLNERGNLIDLVKILKNRLGFIFYVLEDEGSVYTVFEVLNSRGLEVDWLDKCKSMLMGIAFDKFKKKTAKEHSDKLHKVWQQIYRVLGTKKIPGHEILRFAATLKQGQEPSKPLSSEASHEFFKKYCLQKPVRILEVVEWLLDVTRQLESLYSNPRLSAVTSITHARLLAVAILHTEALSNREKKKVLDCWERVTFKIFGLSYKDARTGVGVYVRLAYKIHKEKFKKASEIISELKSISDKYPIDEAISKMEKSDCYNGWESDLRYFLYRYEEHLCKEQKSKISNEIWEQIWSKSVTTSIEHIHPQTKSPNWSGKLGKGKNCLEENVHRIGNLTLLPPNINSECGNKSFKDKKKIYQKNFLRMHEEIISCSDWNKKAIEKREKRLLDWAKDTWSD